MLTQLQKFQHLKNQIDLTIAWFNSLSFNSRDVMIIRIGKYVKFTTSDFINTQTATDTEVLDFWLSHIVAPIDFCKVTEYVSDKYYNMYAYKSPYETEAIEFHDNGIDEWCYYLPESKEGIYTNNIINGINSLYTEISTIPNTVDPNTDTFTLSTKIRTISPLIKNQNTEVHMEYVDGIKAYPKTYNAGTHYQMYQDIPAYVLPVLSYIAYKTNYFKYKDEVSHGDVIIINLDTLCKDVHPNTGNIGILGEFLDSINSNITIQST